MKLLLLMAREYRERVRSKTFIISTLIGLLVILGLSFAPVIIDKIKSADKSYIAVLEQTGQVTTYLSEHLEDKLPNGEREFTFTATKANNAEWASQKKQLIDELLTGKISAVLEVSPPGASDKVIWHSKQIELGGAAATVQTVLQQLYTQQRINDSGLPQGQLAAIFTPLDFNVQPEGLKATTAAQQAQNMALVYFLLFMLYFSLIVYGMYVANGVIEEKSSRIMEMMLSTVKPSTMMTAKIIGIGAVGLTQYFVWIGTGIALITLQGSDLTLGSGVTFQLTTLNPVYLIFFGIFFMLGFLLYAAVYAGIGAMVSRVEDTNQAVSPMTMLIVVGFMLAMFSLYSPNNPWIIAFSYVPFFTPMVLFSRIVLTHVPPGGIILGIVDMLLATVILIWAAGKLYRVGVLMYGKVSWRDFWRVLRS